ncbi:hypothetical protein [Streptomyces sp. NPDC001889]
MPPTASAVVPLPGFGTLAVRTSVTEHGRARYDVRGPHVRGVLVVIPVVTADGPVVPDRVRVQFGDGTSDGRYTARPAEPVARGARIHGATAPISPRTVSTGGHFLCEAVVLRECGETRRIPDGARDLITAAIVAVVRHWNRRPDRDTLLLAAARHRAAHHAAHEERRARKLESELADIRTARAAARRRARQVSALARRRQPAVQPPATAPVRLALTDGDGAPAGVLTVREREVNTLPGRVVYEVTGARVRGLFTVGPDRYHPEPVPRGLYISYGRPAGPSWDCRECSDEPRVNGVRISGGWHHRGAADITPASPPSLPAFVRLARGRQTRAPEASRNRFSAALRALALHYTARPDGEALRIAAAKHHAGHTQGAVRAELAALRAQETRVLSELARHRDRLTRFTALLRPPETLPGPAEQDFARAV